MHREFYFTFARTIPPPSFINAFRHAARRRFGNVSAFHYSKAPAFNGFLQIILKRTGQAVMILRADTG